jgi:diguanylate cyclase (GGDEF)-like protein
MKKTNKLLHFYHSLSLLKKFLLAPALGLVLVLPFYIFAFFSMQEIKNSVQEFNSELNPLQETAYNNILLLEKIANDINSAVTAKEIEWIDSAEVHAQKIRENLHTFSKSDYAKDAQDALMALNIYCTTLRSVSQKIIENGNSYTTIEDDTQTAIANYNTLDTSLKNLKSKIKQEIATSVNSLYENTNFLLLHGNFIFLAWFILSTLIVFVVYRDIRYKINTIVADSREIANGDVDFQKRLCIVSYDELGQIIKSINIFINKLHKSHEELSAAKKELDSLYITDRLTGVYNRVKLDEIIDKELKRRERYGTLCSIILIDIDYFKLVNDTHGHLVGDSILQEFAAILKENIRDTDYVGRWGGEEFMIISPQTDQSGALSLAQHLRANVEEFLFTTIGKKTASFGVATCTEQDDIQSLIDNADKALYKAKESGRNQVVCYNQL